MNEITAVIHSQSVEETHRLGAALAPLLKPGDVIVLSGDLGAGKTQFVQGVAHGLGVSVLPTSPTFTLLMTYEGRLPLHHFDLYRLQSVEELEDLAFFETLEADGVSLIEWGSKFPQALPEDYLELAMESEGGDARCWSLKPRGERARHLVRAWQAAL